jgi:hypothetical protein
MFAVLEIFLTVWMFTLQVLRELRWDQSDSSRKEFVSQISGVDRTMFKGQGFLR